MSGLSAGSFSSEKNNTNCLSEEFIYDSPQEKCCLAADLQLCNAEVSSILHSSDEPESIRRWRTEFQNWIEKKDKLESERVEQMEMQANKELNDWAIQYREHLARARKANRVHDEELKQASEKAFAASAAVAASTVTDPLFWERVCQLCDFFCPSGTTCSSGDGDSKGMNGYPNTMLGFIRSPGKESKDLNRMRSLLLQLKQTPINAKR